jgi:hypothetical protein
VPKGGHSDDERKHSQASTVRQQTIYYHKPKHSRGKTQPQASTESNNQQHKVQYVPAKASPTDGRHVRQTLNPTKALGGEQTGKIASRCDAASAEALALSVNVNQLYDSNFRVCCQFLITYILVLEREHSFSKENELS